MIKLWKHGLLDAHTMNVCNKFLDDLQSESSCPKQTLFGENISQLEQGCPMDGHACGGATWHFFC
jgi:hypothetical protein